MMDKGLLVCKIKLKSRMICIRFCTISTVLLRQRGIQNKFKKLIVKTHVPLLYNHEVYVLTLVTRIDNPWLLLATLPLYHPLQDLKIAPLLQFTPIHFLKSTPLPLMTHVCNFKALLGASLISMNQQVLLRPGTQNLSTRL